MRVGLSKAFARYRGLDTVAKGMVVTLAPTLPLGILFLALVLTGTRTPSPVVVAVSMMSMLVAAYVLTFGSMALERARRERPGLPKVVEGENVTS